MGQHLQGSIFGIHGCKSIYQLYLGLLPDDRRDHILFGDFLVSDHWFQEARGARGMKVSTYLSSSRTEASLVVDSQNHYIVTGKERLSRTILMLKQGFCSSSSVSLQVIQWGRDWLTVQHKSTLTHGAFVALMSELHGPEQCFLVQSKTMFQLISDTSATFANFQASFSKTSTPQLQ